MIRTRVSVPVGSGAGPEASIVCGDCGLVVIWALGARGVAEGGESVRRARVASARLSGSRVAAGSVGPHAAITQTDTHSVAICRQPQRPIVAIIPNYPTRQDDIPHYSPFWKKENSLSLRIPNVVEGGGFVPAGGSPNGSFCRESSARKQTVVRLAGK